MNAGQQVRLASDPTRIGMLTGKSQQLGAMLRLQVQFPDGSQFYHPKMLELVEDSEDTDDPLELIKNGRFKGVDHLRGALTHSRLSGRLANLIYSMETTNTDFYPYQFKPVLNFLDSPSRGLLIADEVGLGKTIEAGLIWTEMKAREQARRLLVVCPAMLKPKWQDELLQRFGVQSQDCNAEELLRLLKQYEHGHLSSFAAVVSMQGLRPPRGWDDEQSNTASAKLARYIESHAFEKPLFDMVIVDEAHYFRNPESQTSKLGRLLRPVTDGLVLLSATPIQMRNQDLFELLHLVDESSFSNFHTFENILNANKPLVDLRESILRGEVTPDQFKEALQEARQHSVLSHNRQIAHLLEEPPGQEKFEDTESRASIADQIESINLFSRVVSRTRKRDVHEWRVVREPMALRSDMTSMEQLFYEEVTLRVREYCMRRDVPEGLLLTIPQRQIASSMPAALRSWLKRQKPNSTDIAWEAGLSDASVAEDDVGPLVSELIRIAQDFEISYEKLKEQDSKFNLIFDNLKAYWEHYPGKKVVLFSYYRETLAYLQERFNEKGYPSVKLVGGMGRDTKQSILKNFQDEAGPSLLLSSEVASEGVDLQFSSLLINYDLPWNPMRVEQRIGRIDRIGQTADKILIWNLFYKDTIDDRIYVRLFNRLEIFKHALGDLEAVLGDEIQRLTKYLFMHKLSRDQEETRIAQTAQAIANENRQNRELEDHAGHLMAHGDYILQQVKAAKELGRYIRDEDLFLYTRDFMAKVFPGCEIQLLDDEDLKCKVLLSTDARRELGEFINKNPYLGRTRLTIPSVEGVMCRFHNNIDRNSAEEIINQNHPLIRFISVSIQDNKTSYHPVIAVQVPSFETDALGEGDYVFSIRRWSVSGAKTQEHLVVRATSLATGNPLSNDSAEKLVNIASVRGKNIVGSSTAFDLDHIYQHAVDLTLKLESEAERFHHSCIAQNNDFVDQQLKSFEEHVKTQIGNIQERIYKLKLEGKTKVVPANQGKIRKLESLLIERTDFYESRRNIHFDPRDVCIGVVRVI